MDVSLLSPNQVETVIIRFEGKSPDSISHGNRILEVLQLFGEVYHQEVRKP